MKKALVTGHLGFAGRHYASALREAGYDVRGIDIAAASTRQCIDGRTFFRQDCTRYDLVVHCAAVVGGRATIDGSPLALASNLELDAGLFQWALRTRPGRVVYLSSSAAYPVHLQHLSDRTVLAEHEIDPSMDSRLLGTPDQLYGLAKIVGENLAYRARWEGLAVTVIRPFSGYGEDQDEVYPFRAFVERAKRRENPFTIWGSAQQVRDFIHIDDVVKATLVMAEKDIDGPVNLGTGRATSMLQLARMVCSAAGYSPLIETDPAKPMGVGYRVADTTLLGQFYKPEVALEQGIRRALA